MYDIRQFRMTLYLVILMGISGFCLAAETPGLWLLAVAGTLLNWWLVRRKRFVPMPRIVANLVTVLALLYVMMQVHAGDSTPILTVGQFLVILHLVKLYEQRANRDFAQMLILSLLLMVAGAISTASLLFGLLLIVYLFVSLYCCLLFHLKAETEAARTALGGMAGKVNPVTLRQDQRFLPRSMRRLTVLVAVVAVAMAVVVFIFFPRGAGAGMFGPLQLRPNQTMSGFSDTAGFQTLARITQSDEVAAYVTVTRNGQKGDFGPLMLRGQVLETYTGNDPNDQHGRWRWLRDAGATDEAGPDSRLHGGTVMYVKGSGDVAEFIGDRDPQLRLPGADPAKPLNIYRQDFYLMPTGTSALFALPGAVRLYPQRDMRLKYSQRDGLIVCNDIMLQPVHYSVESTGDLVQVPDPSVVLPDSRERQAAGSHINPKIKEYALRPEVCGADAAGKALGLLPLAGDHSADAAILANMVHHFETQFSYTLDLSSFRQSADQDPLVAFLYEFKRGHCEYFADAMTLMCQSLHIPARLVHGFASDEYNKMGGYYIVRQSHAHAWVEAFDGLAWRTYDPTSGRDAELARNRSGSTILAVKHFFNYLEFQWANNVVAYDRGDRQNLMTKLDDTMNQLDTSMSRSAVSSSQSVYNKWDSLRKWWAPIWESATAWAKRWGWAASVVIASVIVLALAGMVGRMIYFVVDRVRLRRRAKRIGLQALPHSDQYRLLRQLAFYDDLVRLLERRQIVRPRHLTPLEFSQSLTFLPNDAYDDIRRLTALFYRVRYGGAAINPHRQRRLGNVITRLSEIITVREAPHVHAGL